MPGVQLNKVKMLNNWREGMTTIRNIAQNLTYNAVQITDTADNAAHLQLLRLTHNRRSSCDPFVGMNLAGSNKKADAEH